MVLDLQKEFLQKYFWKLLKKFQKLKNVKFFLATGKNNEEQIILNEILNSKFKNYCVPLDKFSIKEILPIIKNVVIYQFVMTQVLVIYLLL